MKKIYFFLFIISTGFISLLTSLFVLMFFRIIPNLWLYVFPASFIFGVVLGLFIYPILAKFLNNK